MLLCFICCVAFCRIVFCSFAFCCVAFCCAAFLPLRGGIPPTAKGKPLRGLPSKGVYPQTKGIPPRVGVIPPKRMVAVLHFAGLHFAVLHFAVLRFAALHSTQMIGGIPPWRGLPLRGLRPWGGIPAWRGLPLRGLRPWRVYPLEGVYPWGVYDLGVEKRVYPWGVYDLGGYTPHKWLTSIAFRPVTAARVGDHCPAIKPQPDAFWFLLGYLTAINSIASEYLQSLD